MPQRIAVLIVAGLLGSCASSPLDVLQKTTVAIDPGHGGPHSGVAGPSGLLEKDVNLHVALALQEILRSWGVRVVMTRENDVSLSMEVEDDIAARRRLANVSNAELLISIHSNYCSNSDVRGFQVWVPKAVEGARDGQNRALAARVRSELVRFWGQHDLGTRDDHDLLLLREAACAAVLVELECLSNPEVEKELSQPTVHRKLAQGLAHAIRDWVLTREDRR